VSESSEVLRVRNRVSRRRLDSVRHARDSGVGAPTYLPVATESSSLNSETEGRSISRLLSLVNVNGAPGKEFEKDEVTLKARYLAKPGEITLWLGQHQHWNGHRTAAACNLGTQG